jgi:hypothetical protein
VTFATADASRTSRCGPTNTATCSAR